MKLATIVLIASILSACSGSDESVYSRPLMPIAVIDLGTVVTEDIVERNVGNRWRESYGFTRPNQFDVVSWTSGPISGRNSYYTLFSHGGPHVDAPNHYGLEGGLDSYPVEAFLGPLKVFDVSGYAVGRTVPLDVFMGQGLVEGDVVVIYTGYSPPSSDDEFPESIALTRAAAEYLAAIPIGAFGTDAYSAGSRDSRPVVADSDVARAAPIHEAFLAVGIPIYEQLFNVDQLIGEANAYFVGVPANIENGDGMIVRPVALLY